MSIQVVTLRQCHHLIWRLAYSGDIYDPVLDASYPQCEAEFNRLLEIREKLQNDEYEDSFEEELAVLETRISEKIGEESLSERD